MTVQELMDKLKTLPPDLPVWVEGCDCYGPAEDAQEHEDNKDIREKGLWIPEEMPDRKVVIHR